MIEWHTKEKPPADGYYLVTTVTGTVRTDRYFKRTEAWANSTTKIAWAELPKPYRPVESKGKKTKECIECKKLIKCKGKPDGIEYCLHFENK